MTGPRQRSSCMLLSGKAPGMLLKDTTRQRHDLCDLIQGGTALVTLPDGYNTD